MTSHYDTTITARASRPPKKLTAKQTRELLERGVETLLSILNEIDGDADAEPSLAGAAGYGDQRHWAQGATDDREHGCDPREPDEDDEFNLGRSENIDQTRPEFPSDDYEPSLGGLHALDQRRWADDASEWRFQDMEEEHDGREPEDYAEVASYGLDQRIILGAGIA